MPLSQLPPKLPQWVDDGIHLSAEALLSRAQQRGRVSQTQRAEDHQVNVAGASRLSSCERPEQERYPDLPRGGAEGVAEDICQARGLDDERSQLAEHGAGRVGAVTNLVAPSLAEKNPGASQVPQLALDGTQAAADAPRRLAEVECLAWLAEEKGQ